MKTLASIDIGSQTIRLLVAQCDDSGRVFPLYRDREIIRLGEGLQAHGILQENAIKRAVTCIERFVSKAQFYKASEIFSVATACVRNAENAAVFLDTVAHTTGNRPSVLSGEQEALLSLKGVHSIIPPCCEKTLVIDIGGGSTELIITNNTMHSVTESLALGVIGLSEKFLSHDPPLDQEIRDLSAEITSVLKSHCTIFTELYTTNAHVYQLIGTAGTVTTLAAMDLLLQQYDPDKINGHVLQRGNIEKLFAKMIRLPSCERSLLPGLEQGRSIVIIPGSLVVLIIMDILQQESLLVSDCGLLEGIVIDKLHATK